MGKNIEIFNQNLDNLKKDLADIRYELRCYHRPSDSLNLYDTETRLKEIINLEIKSEAETENPNVRKALLTRKTYLKKSYNALCVSAKVLGTWITSSKDSIKETMNSTSIKIPEERITYSEHHMLGAINSYYENVSTFPNREYLFWQLLKNRIYDIPEEKRKIGKNNLYCNTLDKKAIFIENTHSAKTMADIVYEIEHMHKKMGTSIFSTKDMNEHTYHNSSYEIEALISKKQFLNYIKEKDSNFFRDSVNEAYQEEYQRTLSYMEEIENFFENNSIKEENDNDMMNKINYVYGQLLSDIYLCLNQEEQRKLFEIIGFNGARLFDARTLHRLEKFLRQKDYDISEISSIQYTKYIK